MEICLSFIVCQIDLSYIWWSWLLCKIILFYDKNYDDLGTVIPTVLREPETNTKIIVLEPMKIYGEDFVQSIVEKSNENGDKIIHVKNYPNIILIKPSFFSENFCNYDQNYDCLKWLEKENKNGTVVLEYNDIYNL